jgi:AraC-like DNA-binding protein
MFEREANQGGSELLFQRDIFRDVAAEYEIGIASIVELSEKFGASIRATLRRFAETHNDNVSAFVLDRQPISTSPLVFRRREAVASSVWCSRFGNPARWPIRLGSRDLDIVNIAASAGGRNRWGGKAILTDLAGEAVNVEVDVLDNTYQLLVVAWIPTRQLRLIRRRRILASAG